MNILFESLIKNARSFPDGFNVELARHSGEPGAVKPSIQEKKWGWELWLVFTDKYALKVLYVNKGHRLSLQRHKQKQESWLVLSGEPELRLGELSQVYKSGDLLHIPAGTVHRVSAPGSDIEILEVSTPELADVERLEDDYGRR